MILIFLLLAAVVFVIYAVAKYYQATEEGDPVPKRVWASVVAALAAVGAAITAWFAGATP